jgi:hypothetical protein
MSGTVRYFRGALELDPLWQFGTRKSLADTVSANVGNLAKAVEEAQSQQDRRVNANTDIGIASFYALQRGARCESALSDNGHGQPTSATSILNIRT